MSNWFARERVDDDVWHIWEPEVHRFIRCNIWLVKGRDRALLVDTGLGVVSLATAIHDLLDQPVTAAATHYHFDHTGSLHEFDDRIAHVASVPYLKDSSAMGGALHRAGFGETEWQEYINAGYELDDELLFALPEADFEIDAYAVAPCPPTRTLAEGDVIDLGDRTFTVLHLPGHSPDSIGLFDETDGTLFSGDAVYDGPLLDNGDDASISDYIVTMERLRMLPVRVVHGGHDPSFGRDRLVELCDAYLARRR
jgi:glyoxylase-like metal-dependent hydrolase (beta-lactamase superfamily II)